MAGKILKGLAVAAGAGLAIGFGGKRRSLAVSMSTPSDNIPAIETLLERLDCIEARMSAIEASNQSAAHPMPVADSLSFAEFDGRIEQQTKDIEALQVQLSETRQALAREVPTMLESMLASTLGPHLEDLRARLQAEVRESVETTLISFERVIDTKVSLRVSTLEKAIIEQSGIITTLSQRAIESDSNLQRLISAVERLCERPDARPAPSAPATPARAPSLLELPFERHLSEAIKRQPEPPDSGFRPRILKEDDEKPRHRKPLTRI
jgi:uncharacterized coiled-coil protein SlyX